MGARAHRAAVATTTSRASDDATRAGDQASGLTYSLLTKHTSFIAVLEQVRNTRAAPPSDVQQPLPLPQGVSELAVGEAYGSGAEPEVWLLMLLRRWLALGAAVREAPRGPGRRHAQ